MKKHLTLAFLALILLPKAYGEDAGKKPVKYSPLVKFESAADKMLRYSRKEAQAQKRKAAPAALPGRQARKTNSTQASSISFVDLGKSINPFTSVSSGRNYLSVNPDLNTVVMVRRGGENNPGGATDKPGNKLFYDYSKAGGMENTWTLGKGPLFSDDNYVNFPGYNVNSANYGPRYPQGVLWNPAGNTNPDSAYVFSAAAVLNGTNDTWGGQGKGWKKLGSTTAAKEAFSTSGDYLHYITDAMEVNASGDIFFSEPELIADAVSTTFTNRIIVYRYRYNSTTQSFDSTVTFLPFVNEEGDLQTRVAGTAISFSPSTQTGYVVVSAFNNAYDSAFTTIPYIAKTTDGGNTWSDFKMISYNLRHTNYESPGLDSFRTQMFGNFVRFTEEGIVSANRGDDYAHRVDYFLKDFDVTVDQNDYAHIFAQLCVASFGDTDLINPTDGLRFRPGLGSWLTDLTIKDLDTDAKGYVLAATNSVRGCFGDCDTDENIEEDSRPQVARSADGSRIAFVWFDTDTAAHPQTSTNTNGNPDLWMRTLKVSGVEQFSLSDMPRNMTKASDFDGLIICGTVAPILLNTPTGYDVAAAAVSLPGTTITEIWPTQHFFIRGLHLPDTIGDPVNFLPRIVANETLVQNAGASSLQFSVVPNPAGGAFSLQLLAKEGATARFEVTNVVGQLVYSKQLMLQPGANIIPVDAPGLRAGIYTATLRTGKNIATKRIIRN